MKERNVLILVVISLIIGTGFGAGITYVVYGPKINALSSQVTSLNSQISDIDSSLIQIEGNLSELRSKSGVVEKETGTIPSIQSNIDQINKKLNVLETQTQKNEELIGSLTELNEQTIIDVYNNVSPAVVFITSTVLSYDFQQQTTVPEVGVGSGVVVGPEGYILTNNHVVEDAEFITVSFRPGEELEAELIGTDPATDLAVIKIDPTPDLPVATLGDSDKVKVGMTAIAIGNPFSLERTITAGVVSAVNRTIDAETGEIIFGVIQTDASINPGNSGGPLVNTKGEVIGITSAIISPVRGSVGIGFAIPINTAKEVMAQLIEKGYVSRPYLGITGASVGEFPPELNLTNRGVLIVDVFVDSPADKAGLRGSDTEFQVGSIIYPVGGDIIIRMDGQDIITIEDLLEFLSKKDVGDVVTIGYLRNGEESSVEVLLEERPS